MVTAKNKLLIPVFGPAAEIKKAPDLCGPGAFSKD